MRWYCLPVIVALVAVGPAPLPGDDKKAAASPTIEELVVDLGNPDYATREKAQRELWLRGDAAIPALNQALSHTDPEVVRRAGELLAKFAWGIRPDTPAAVLKLLRAYQAGDANPVKSAELRRTAILGLLREGSPGVAVVRAILGKDLPDDTRAQLDNHLTVLLRHEVPRRLFDGKVEEAAELLSVHAAGTGVGGAGDYAVFQVLNNKLPEAIQRCESALKTTRRTAEHRLVLAYLYRAARQWDNARAMAEDLTPRDSGSGILDLLREDAGDWGALADHYPFGAANHPNALRLTFLRLSGRDKTFDEELDALFKASNNYSSGDEIFQAAVALFSNHRAGDATRLLLDKKQNLGLLGEVLITRLRYKDALELITSLEKPEAQLSSREKLEFDLRRARVLMVIGRRGDAVQLFNKVAEGLEAQVKFADSATPITAIRSLLRTEMRVGLKDLAGEHAARFITSGIFARYGYSYTGETPFEILFNHDSTAAEMIFQALRAKRIPGEEAGPTMARTRELLLGKANKLAVDEAIKAIRDAPEQEVVYMNEGMMRSSPIGPSKAFQYRQQLAIAAVCRAANRDTVAETAYRTAAELAGDDIAVNAARSWAFGTSDAYLPSVEWGDFLCDRNRYHEAARVYLEGWEKFPDQPLLMLLSGRALVLAGAKEEGERRMELSHWVSLGQERVRGRFLDELIRRGEGKAARREIELVLRACWSRDYYFGNVMNQAARAAAMIKDFDTAEKACLRSNLVMLKTQGMYYVDPAAYLNAPHSLLVYRARARLAAGQLDEAVKLARDALAVTPGHVELVAGMVPILEKQGRKADAAELFGIAWTAYRDVLADYPESPATKNALASLAAGCRRELAEGLKYAQEAVKAEPASAPFRETLAEVHFRRGDRDKAVAEMNKLLADEPRNPLYKRQLSRYQSAAFDSPKPETVD